MLGWGFVDGDWQTYYVPAARVIVQDYGHWNKELGINIAGIYGRTHPKHCCLTSSTVRGINCAFLSLSVSLSWPSLALLRSRDTLLL